jgi:hypothetical protein
MLWRPNVLFETVFKLRVIYKSGYAIDFEVTEYEIGQSRITWTSANFNFRPINMNYNEVAGIWKVGQRKRLRFFNK